MATRPPKQITRTFQDIQTGLTEGEDYLLQHVGGSEIEYCDHPTDPTSVSIAKHLLRPYEWIRFTVEAAEPTWMRVSLSNAHVAISPVED